MTQRRQQFLQSMTDTSHTHRPGRGRLRHILVLWFAACACCTVHQAEAQTRIAFDSSLSAIRSIYEKGSYLGAEVEARRYLEQQPSGDSLRITAEQYLAFALVAQGKGKAAVRHFSLILEIDSTFALDPVYTSPKILAAFDEARQLRHSAQRIEPQQPVQAQNVPAAAPAVSWRSLVFPGWEQLHQGRTTQGYALAAAGTLAAGLSIGVAIDRSNARHEYLAASTPAQATARYDRYDRANKAEVYSILAFAAIYLYSEVDAFVNLPHADAVTLLPGGSGLRLAIRF